MPKIHQRLHSVSGRPIISNSGFYTENISAFLDLHCKPIATKVKSYIKDTNDFLRKLQNLAKLADDVILCAIDVVGLYPNILNEEDLLFLKKALDKQRNKTVSTESHIELAELVLRNNCFEFNDRFKKQKEGTAIGTKFAPPCAIIFVVALEEEILESLIKKPWLWWRYIDDIGITEKMNLNNLLKSLTNFIPP